MAYTFRLGITLAGAVSAGCYTAGALDYLLECLEAWENAKQSGANGMHQEHVPKSQVRIDAVGGSSAGGMTGMLLVLQYLKSSNLLRNKEYGNSLLYRSWVEFRTSNNSIQLPKDLFDLEDAKNPAGRMPSAVNGNFLERLAEDLFKKDEDLPLDKATQNLPPYLSKRLELILTHTLLEGIPLQVDFQAAPMKGSKGESHPHHTTYEHHLQTHFKLMENELHEHLDLKPHQSAQQQSEEKVKTLKDEKKYLRLDPFHDDHALIMQQAALATGAFPIGLPSRPLGLSRSYLKAAIERNLFRTYGNRTTKRSLAFDPTHALEAPIVTVDGGAVNNEPYQEVIDVLRFSSPHYNDGDGESSATKTKQEQDFGVILIDPFPDHSALRPTDKTEEPSGQEGNQTEQTINEQAGTTKHNPLSILPTRLSTLGSRMVRVLWNAAKTKRREMLEEEADRYIRGQIWPVKLDPKNKEKLDYPLASGSLDAFGGLFEPSFREHDYQLGRDNTRNFIGHWFRMPFSETGLHPMYQDWPKEAIDRFKFIDNNDGKTYLPIIPDFLQVKNGVPKSYPYDQYRVPDLPSISVDQLKLFQPKIRKRVRRIIFDESRGRVIERMGLGPRGKSKKSDEPKNERYQSPKRTKSKQKNQGVQNKAISRMVSNSGFLGFIPRTFVGVLGAIVAWFAPTVLSKPATRAIMRSIIKDFNRRSLLDIPAHLQPYRKGGAE